MLEKEKFIEEAINKYIEAYRIIGEISALSRDAQRAMLYVRHTVAEKIYETAKAHGLKEYEKQYRTEMKKTRPRSWSSLPRMDVLKELWSKDVTGQGGPFDPLTTCVETMADMISGDWDDELLGALNKLVGFSVPAVFAWCRRNVYFWRIPFYPALSMILMLVLHFTNGYTDWSRRSLCYWDCLAAQSLYQCTASLAMAIAFCVINSIGRLKRKKLALAGAAVILGAVAGWYSMQVMGRRWLTPDNMHYAFLIIPFYTAFVGRMYTKIANTFLGRIERK